MFKQIILPILGVIIFIIVIGIFAQKSSSLGLTGQNITGPTMPPEKSITVGSKKIQVQIADTEEKRTKGLSGVASLKTDGGMLFVFDTKGVTPIFWMKDMLIPLDIVWIRSSSGDVSNAKIVRIDKNIPIPAPGTPDSNLQTYSAGAPIDYVLEVNAGFSDANNLKVGSAVDLSAI